MARSRITDAMHSSNPMRTQHDDFARASVGTESHFRVEKGVRLAIIGSGIHPT